MLTKREIEIIKWIAKEETTKGIALKLGIATKTVEWHRLRAMRKIGIDNYVGLAKFAIRKRWVTLYE